MQKIVLDTNVLVSALIGTSHPTEIVQRLIFENKVVVALSEEVFEEYITVLNRDKFKQYDGFLAAAQIVLNRIYELSIKYSPSIKFETLSDKSDDKFLELAFASSAQFLVTGNIKDFRFANIETVKIVTPQEYMDQWKKQYT